MNYKTVLQTRNISNFDDYVKWLNSKVVSCQDYDVGEPGYMVSTDIASHPLVAAVILIASQYGVPFSEDPKYAKPEPWRQDTEMILAVASRCVGKPSMYSYFTDQDVEELGLHPDYAGGGYGTEGTGKTFGQFFWFEMGYDFFEEWKEYE